MRAVLQRVSAARVSVEGAVVGAIDRGLLVLLGVAPTDTIDDARWLAEKICALRIFEDTDGKMNLSVAQLPPAAPSSAAPAPAAPTPPAAGEPPAAPLAAPRVLVVSQFTLFASTRKGTRPSFNDAAKPDVAIPLYEAFVRCVGTALAAAAVPAGAERVATGRFGAMMEVALVNDGPVTLVIDTKTRE